MADISNKERFRQRYAKRNPDLNMDDEEAYYGSVNQFMDEYEGYEGNSKENAGEPIEESSFRRVDGSR